MRNSVSRLTLGMASESMNKLFPVTWTQLSAHGGEGSVADRPLSSVGNVRGN